MTDSDVFSAPGDYVYSMHNQYVNPTSDNFGFDPVSQGQTYSKSEAFSPAELGGMQNLSDWGFDIADSKEQHQTKRDSTGPNPHTYELDRTMTRNLPNNSSAIVRYGTITPPRSNSASSEDHNAAAENMSPKTGASDRRKRSIKPVIKEEPSDTAAVTSARKRKNARRLTAASEEHDDKRRQSLEKNRLAAAKCRVNKKEKTEQLQRDSHEKAVHNAFLRDQIMRMKEEVQQMNALLLTHANCDGCKSPEEVQKHLSNLGNEFFSHQMQPMGYGDYSQVNLSEMPHLVQQQGMHHNYFEQSHDGGSLASQSLPDFDGNADFEVHTPMQND